MPELPEVEVVRRGLERWVVGRTIRQIEVHHPRAVRRHPQGPEHLARLLAGARVVSAQRRGKYLWLPLEPSASRPDDDAPAGRALLAHLGMSGQLLVGAATEPDQPHLRVRIEFADAGPQLRFVDQRTFGGVAVVALDLAGVPLPVGHIGRDPLDPQFDDRAFARSLRVRTTGLKRALLDQRLISGIGNIYADEALWRARLHYARRTQGVTQAEVSRVLAAVRAVMTEALRQGGTSFDALYVDVNGSSGYFSRSLAVYGRAGQPCLRCATLIRREPFMNRSSYRCPTCQPPPRSAHG
ncbi:MAG: bifunctional DNA-formamidopyrimidine glycosylase/DNA-(apurinic or apyrimidinic site) lyase [Actinomycetes bacterium]